MKRIVRTAIGRDRDGSPLIDFLSERFTYHSRERWLARISEGRLLINGIPADSQAVLSAGDDVEYVVPPIPEPPVPRRARFVYEDPDLLAVDKPAGLPIHPAGRFFNNTLWAVLKEQRPTEHFEFVNRLDRETSGLVLLGRHSSATRDCRRQMACRRVTKEYRVLVEGEFPDELAAAGWLVPHPDSVVRRKRLYTERRPPARVAGATDCVTRFRRLSYAGGVSFLSAELHTGRLHQIRATLCSLGFPVVGDKVYGVDETIFPRFAESGRVSPDDLVRLRLPRQGLHACRLGLRHPTRGGLLVLESILPGDMCDLCRQLGLDVSGQPRERQ